MIIFDSVEYSEQLYMHLSIHNHNTDSKFHIFNGNIFVGNISNFFLYFLQQSREPLLRSAMDSVQESMQPNLQHEGQAIEVPLSNLYLLPRIVDNI